MPVGGRGKDADIRVTFTAEGENNVVAALRDQIAATKQLRQENKAAKKDTQQLRQEQKKTARSATDLGRSFRNILLRTVAIIGVLRTLSAIRAGFDRLITTGIKYNETIETATLSIAALITATSDLVDVNGQVLEGAQALDVAYQLAEDQVQKLRIAGIQTAATTQELVDAFQQAVGAGLQTGLTLDQIRNVTIRLTQAAGALGVPYRQLNEEIRSILGGIIDQNTRIAKALGITNDQVRAAKEQGRLYEFLNEQFEAFGTAGDRILTTFSALRSTVQETIELLSGEAVRPLFDALRVRGLDQIQRIFDFDTAEIADEFKPLIEALQAFFTEIGDLAGDLIEGLVDGLQLAAQNGDYLRVQFTRIGDSTARIVKSVLTWFKNVGGTGDLLAGIAQILETIADIMETIANNAILFKVTLAAVGVGIGALLVSVFGTVGAAVLGAVTALGLLIANIDQATVSERERLRAITDSINAQQRQNVEFVEQTKRLDFLVDSYEDLIDRLDDAAKGSAEYKRIISDIKDIEEEIAAQGLAELLKVANGERQLTLDLLRDELELRRINLGLQYDELELARDRLIAEQVAAEVEALRRAGVRPGTDPRFFSQSQRQALEQARTGPEGRARLEAISQYDEALGDLFKSIEELNAILSVNTVRLRSNAQAQEDNAAAAKKLRDARFALQEAIINRDLARAEFEAARDLENAAISIAEYYDRIRAARERALAGRLAIQTSLLSEAETEADRLQIQARIVQLLGKDALQILQEEQAELKARNKLLDEGREAQARYYELTGQEARAAIEEVSAKYDELIQKLLREGEFELAAFAVDTKALEVARAEFTQFTREVKFAQDELTRIQRETDLLLDTGLITQEDANQRLAAAYQTVGTEVNNIRGYLENLIATSQDPELVNKARELLILFEEAGINVRQLTDEWLRFQKSVRDAAEDSLANYLSDAFIEAENLGEALRNLGDIRSLLADIITQVIQLTSRLIAMKIIQSIPIFGAAGGGEVTGNADGGLITGYASGGRVRGPGGPTADKVPALLSAGEYVIRAASVKKYGTELLSKLNAGVLPRQPIRFQTGGLVGSLAQAGSLTQDNSDALRGELSVGLQDGLVLRDMNSPDGRRLILKVIQDNRRAVSQSLGAG